MSRRYGLPGAALRIRRFRACDRGASALEFGFIALPFLMLLFAILELALIFWSSQVLETAVSAAARQIYTGQFQQANASLTTPDLLRAKFKTAVCEQVRALFNCTTRVDVDVQTFDDFRTTTVQLPVTRGVYDPSTFTYDNSNLRANRITLVRASMEYPVYVSRLLPLGQLANGNRLIVASTTFRTEPY